MNSIINEMIHDQVLDIQPLGDGNFSHGFKVIGEKKTYFLRKFKHNVHGYEYQHDEKRSFENSHFMMQLFRSEITSYGTFSFEGHVYHIQDYFEGHPLSLDQLNDDITSQIAKKIAHLHTIGRAATKTFDEEKKKRLYARSLREYITNFEGVLGLFEHSLEKEPFFEEYFPKVRNKVFSHTKKYTHSRLTALHGDFWFGNILYNGNTKQTHFVDFSISPFGEPGIDIGWFIGDLELRSLFGNREKYMQLKHIFLETYIAETKDHEIVEYFDLMNQFKGLKLLSPLVQQFLQRDASQKDIVKTRLRGIDK